MLHLSYPRFHFPSFVSSNYNNFCQDHVSDSILNQPVIPVVNRQWQIQVTNP